MAPSYPSVKASTIVQYLHKCVFPRIGVFPPKWMVKIMENPVKMDDLGGKPTIFGNTRIEAWWGGVIAKGCLITERQVQQGSLN